MKKIAAGVCCAVILTVAGLYAYRYAGMAETEHAAAPDRAAAHNGQREKALSPLHDHDAEQERPSQDHVLLTEAQVKTMGIAIATAGPGKLRQILTLQGEIRLNSDRIAHVTPYVSGHVKRVWKSLGDTVLKGEAMAVLESRELADAKTSVLSARERVVLAEARFFREESLWEKKISSEEDYLDAKQALAAALIERRSAEQKLTSLGLSGNLVDRLSQDSKASLTRYNIVSPLQGRVLERKLTIGEMVESDRVVFVVADMESVWVNISVYQKDLVLLKEGMKVEIAGMEGRDSGQGILVYIAPIVDETTRTARVLATLPNPTGQWRPGRFVKAGIPLETKEFPVVVSKDAIQTLNDQPVVFVPSEGGFEARPVSPGRSDTESMEVASGLSAGDPYVASGAFELKAAILMESLGDHAGHGH